MIGKQSWTRREVGLLPMKRRIANDNIAVLWLFVTRSMVLWALFVIAHSSASAQATTCGSWASVTGWKGEYTLTGSGSVDYGGGASATVNYSSRATMHLKRPGPQLCPSATLGWEGKIEATDRGDRTPGTRLSYPDYLRGSALRSCERNRGCDRAGGEKPNGPPYLNPQGRLAVFCL
jgi:hypothetical protein